LSSARDEIYPKISPVSGRSAGIHEEINGYLKCILNAGNEMEKRHPSALQRRGMPFFLSGVI